MTSKIVRVSYALLLNLLDFSLHFAIQMNVLMGTTANVPGQQQQAYLATGLPSRFIVSSIVARLKITGLRWRLNLAGRLTISKSVEKIWRVSANTH
jgi:hypothetical protein